MPSNVAVRMQVLLSYWHGKYKSSVASKRFGQHGGQERPCKKGSKQESSAESQETSAAEAARVREEPAQVLPTKGADATRPASSEFLKIASEAPCMPASGDYVILPFCADPPELKCVKVKQERVTSSTLVQDM